MVTWLPDVETYDDGELSGAAHPNRPALDAVVSDPDNRRGWDALREDYQRQAPDWAEWADSRPNYDAPLRSAMAHIRDAHVVLEVGAGSDSSSLPLTALARTVITSDVAEAMISRNPAPIRLVCDVRSLPFPDHSIDVVCGLNAVPHFGEFERVISPRGQLLWASSFGPNTPMYVSPDELERRLAGWTATAQRVSAGEWCILERNP